MSELTASQKETLAIFTSGADKLAEIVAGLSETELDYSIASGEWTIRQIIHHVAEDGDAWSMQFKRALVAPGVRIHRVEGISSNDAWADALAYNRRPIGISLSLLRAHRGVIAELAERFPDTWEQCVTFADSHGGEKRVSAGDIIRMVGEHLVEHVSTIETIKRQHGI